MNDQKHHLPIMVASMITLCIGIGLGWSAKSMSGSSKGMKSASGEMQGVGQQRSTHANGRGELMQRSELNALLERVSKYERPGPIPELDPGVDPKQIIDALIQGIGFGGLNNAEWALMDQQFENWYAKEPDAALQWALARDQERDVANFLSDISGFIAEQGDLDAAVDFVNEYGNSRGLKIRMPNNVHVQLNTFNPEDLVKLCSTFRIHGMLGMGLNFPSDYPYGEALDAFADACKDMPEGRGISYVPSNMLTAWAKRDPSAAWDWARSGKEVPFNGLKELATEYASYSSADQVTSRAIDMMNLQDPDINTVCHLLEAQPTQAVIASFLNQMPGDREENLINIINSSKESWRPDDGRHFHATLIKQMSPDERIRVLEKCGGGWVYAKNYRNLLMELGHTEKEISGIKWLNK